MPKIWLVFPFDHMKDRLKAHVLRAEKELLKARVDLKVTVTDDGKRRWELPNQKNVNVED